MVQKSRFIESPSVQVKKGSWLIFISQLPTQTNKHKNYLVKMNFSMMLYCTFFLLRGKGKHG
jgi:hypothetical protein